MRSSVFVLLSLLPVGDSYRTTQENIDEIEVDDADEFGFRCPHGLEANYSSRKCCYRGELFEDPDQGMTEAWAGGSEHPLIFKPWGGLDDPEGELIQELQFMLTQPEFVRHHVRMSMVHHHGHEHTGAAADVHGLVERLEQNSENLEALEFVAEHAVEHLVIEGLAVGLTTLGHAAAHGGLLFAAEIFEGTAVGLEVIGGVLGSPIVLGFSAVRTAFQVRNHFLTKDAHSRSFAVGLVSKADCIASKVTLSRESIVDDQNQLLDNNFFVPEFAQVCGADIEPQLASQMVKTNAAMLALFQELKGIGKCLFPEGRRAWSKSNCVHAVYEDLRSHDGESGILFSSLALAAAYGQETDEILSKPVYGEWFERYLNISLPHARDVQQDLIRVRNNAQASIQEKATTCLSIVGLHRAFERVFVRLKTALELFMHTFARHKIHFSLRTIQYPCRRVFREFEDRAQGLCKDGTDLPLLTPETEWMEVHAQHLTNSMLSDVGACIEDTHPELSLSLTLASEGPEEGENEEEEHEGHDEE